MGISRAVHFSTISALALTAMRWITRGTNFETNCFLHQFPADVHAGSAGRRDPQLRLFLFSVVGEAIDQAELLDHPQA